jgi:putative hydrolase of the HAD superfamily
MRVRAVLLDADGVVQENPDGWLERLKATVGDGKGQEFADDVFATEQEAMTGDRDFGDVIAEVADRWGLTGSRQDLLEHWRRIEVSAPVVELVGELRAAGIRCCLASNQNSFRARYMRDALGYEKIFDSVFFSCDLGVLKTSPRFFTSVLSELDLPAGEVLFVDDGEHYVETARDVGLRAFVWSTGRGIDVLRAELAAHGLPA